MKYEGVYSVKQRTEFVTVLSILHGALLVTDSE
jgi:hypothetical protein